MTASLAWIRTFENGTQELILASDSRMSGGLRFDATPKIFPFERGDCALTFAGEVSYAYPLMIQLATVFQAHRPARTRALDIGQLRTHLIHVFNTMLQRDLHDVADESQKNPDLSFIFGGYSNVNKRFEIFIAVRNAATSRFEWQKAYSIAGRQGLIAAIGDGASTLLSEIRKIVRRSPTLKPWNWEPMMALRDICRNALPKDTVGGPVQLAKVHQHMNVSLVPVFWPDRKSGQIALRGRILMTGEKIDSDILDLDTFKMVSPP